MRHIVIDVRRIGDFGIGTYIRNLVRTLAEVDKDSRYTLIVRPGETAVPEGLGSAFSTAAYGLPDTELLHNFSFPRFLKHFSAHLYHIPLNSVAWWMPKPYVLTIHDMSSLLFPARQDIRGTLHQERYRRGALRASRVITVSNSTRRDIEQVLHVPADRIRTIYSAPDPAFSGALDAVHDRQILDRYSIHYPFILYAGTIRPQKNIPRLIEAFAVLRAELDRHPDYSGLHLVIIGDEITRNPAVRRAVAQARIESNVRFLGFVPTETLRVFYRAATLFAFPSLYEGFGLAPLEAMACGTPVVASDIPALVEAVGTAALLVSPDNVFDIARGLREILLDSERRRSLSIAGRAQAARFRWERTAREVLAIYQETLSN
jgi:glycosyltransferase involved in cell wall biosynthesis